MKEKTRYYLTATEKNPHRSNKSKKGIAKVMFLSAIAKSKCNAHNWWEHDLKIWVWPVVTKQARIRSLKNRPSGTMVMGTVVVTTNLYELLLQKTFPYFRPTSLFQMHVPAVIEQNNARLRIEPHHTVIIQARFSSGRSLKNTVGMPSAKQSWFDPFGSGVFRSFNPTEYNYNSNLWNSVTSVEHAFQEYRKTKFRMSFWPSITGGKYEFSQWGKQFQYSAW